MWSVLQNSIAGALVGGSIGYIMHATHASADDERNKFAEDCEYLSLDARAAVRSVVPEVERILVALADLQDLRLPGNARSELAFDDVVASADDMVGLCVYTRSNRGMGSGATLVKMHRCFSAISHHVGVLKEEYIQSEVFRTTLHPCDEICEVLLGIFDGMIHNLLNADRSDMYRNLGEKQ